MIYLLKEHIKKLYQEYKDNLNEEKYFNFLSYQKTKDPNEFLIEKIYNIKDLNLDKSIDLESLVEKSKSSGLILLFHLKSDIKNVDIHDKFLSDILFLNFDLNIGFSSIKILKFIDENFKELIIKIRKNILFVCVENSCRSQIAEGIANHIFYRKFKAYSSGSKPSFVVNPDAILVMKEIGIDISNQKSKGFDSIEKDIEFDYIVTMGCGDVCPFYPAKEKIDWNIKDPKGQPLEVFRQVRDEIKNNIEKLYSHIKD